MEIRRKQEVRVVRGVYRGLVGAIREIWSQASGSAKEVVLPAKGGSLVSVPVTDIVDSKKPRPKINARRRRAAS